LSRRGLYHGRGFRRRAYVVDHGQLELICQLLDGGAAMILRSEIDIAEKVTNENLTISSLDLKRFRIITNFRPQWTGESRRAATQQIATVKVLNTRKD